MIAAEVYMLSGSILIEKGIAYVPILISTDNARTVVKNVFVPEIYDATLRKEDLNNIFGEYNYGFELNLEDYMYREIQASICSIKYQIALLGGYNGFPNSVTHAIIRDFRQRMPRHRHRSRRSSRVLHGKYV